MESKMDLWEAKGSSTVPLIQDEFFFSEMGLVKIYPRVQVCLQTTVRAVLVRSAGKRVVYVDVYLSGTSGRVEAM